ncbi:MAG TPA: cation transporter [Bacillota bacterium]|nr:cation transporter [Bacillota bacterium]
MKVSVDNMTCGHCKMHIENALKNAGFKKFKVDLDSKTVDLDLGKHTLQEAKSAVEGIGYHFQVIEE